MAVPCSSFWARLPRVKRLLDLVAPFRCALLMVALLVMMIITAVTPDNSTRVAVLHFVILLSGVYAVSRRRVDLICAVVVAVPVLIAVTVDQVLEIKAVEIAAEISAITFYAVVTGSLLAHVLRPGQVDADRIFGAACIYLLLGITFALVYNALENHYPGSFDEGKLAMNDLVYFSFATLTTLGYGDISPDSDFARIIAVIEASTGVLYTAILVARLVSLYRSSADT